MYLTKAKSSLGCARKYGILIGIVLLAVFPIVVLGSRLDSASQALGDTPPPVIVGETREVNGISLTLSSLSMSAMGAEASFDVSLPPEVANSPLPDVLGPLFSGEQLHVTGFALPLGQTTLRGEPHRTGDVSLQFSMALGPVVDPSQAATITFEELPFLIGESQPATNISGPWEFSLAPSLFSSDAPLSSRDVDLVAQQDGATVTVSRIESRPSGLYVDYSVASQTTKPITAVVPLPRLVFGDGSTAWATTVGSLNQGNSVEQNTGATFVAVFHPVKTPGATADLQFGPYLTSNGESASVTIQNLTSEWSATPITIGGDQLAVSQVEYSASDERLVVTVQNNEPLESAEIMFLGVDAPRSITAVDENGRQYNYQSASTGMRRQGGTLLGAGASTFTFEGVSGSVQRLTLTVDHSSILLRGPWSVSVQLP